MITTVDKKRVVLVLDRLLSTYQNGEFPYNLPGAVLPQDAKHLPHGLTDNPGQHAMWLFCLCYYMRGGIQSVVAAQRLSILYIRCPQLFDSRQAALLDEVSVEHMLRRAGLAYLSRIIPAFWIENAKRLNEWYDGDPRNIYDQVDSFEAICLRLCNESKRKKGSAEFTRRQGFFGFREKMASMLSYYYMEAGLVKSFNFPVPVDFHVLRVSIATGMVNFRDIPDNRDVYSQELLARLRRLYEDYAARHNISPIILTNVIWLPSNQLCSRHPGNISLVGLEDGTRGTRGYKARFTDLTPYNPAWTKAELRTHANTCALCPVEDFCNVDIPNAYYTRKGQLLVLRPRSRPPSEQRRML